MSKNKFVRYDRTFLKCVEFEKQDANFENEWIGVTRAKTEQEGKKGKC